MSSPFKNVLLNAGVLISGGVTASLINLVSFALLARILGPELFGVLALVQAYVVIIDRFINFQSWQALIKYGSVELENNNVKNFNTLLSYGFTLDIITAIIATAMGVLIPHFFGEYLHWTPQKIQIASIFSLVIIFNIEGTPTAILRLFDEFKQFAYKDILVASLKLILILIGYLYSSSLWYFIIAIMLSLITGYMYLILSALLTLKKNKIQIQSYFNLPIIISAHNQFIGLKSFIITTNVHSTIRMLSLNLDTLIVDYMLGSKATGLYQIAKQFAKVFTQISQPLYKSIYPELTRIWATKNKKNFKLLIKRFITILGAFGILGWIFFFAFGKLIITYTVGTDYIDSYDILIFYLLGVGISVTFFPITPALLAIGKPNIPFLALILSTIIYLILLVLFIIAYGIQGAGMAYLGLYGTWLIVIAFYIKKNQLKSLYI